MNGLIVDNFAGGGGASTGIEMALGRSPDIAVNHDPEAVAMHAANHPATKHLCESVWQVDPVAECAGRPVSVAWFSPDCTFFSRAKGAQPISRGRRVLAHVVVRWARDVRPATIFLENVLEFLDWGPVHHKPGGRPCEVCSGAADGRPCPARRGRSFRRWVSQLRRLGYQVEWRLLTACDYGAPTSRRRLFVVARCDGRPIVWPEPTHGPGRQPFRTAAECIDWSIPCPSIFERERELSENTMRRIARGIKRYVIDAAKPFIVTIDHTSNPAASTSVDDPLSTITSKARHTVVAPFIAGVGGRQGQSPERAADRPFQTITTKADSVIVAPTMVQVGYGEREGQAPRCLDIPLGTVVAQGGKHALGAAFLAKHYGGNETPGADLRDPMSTITTQDHHAVITVPFAPMGADRRPEVRAFLTAYYSTDQAADLRGPLPTVTTHDRFGVVTVAGHDFEIVDIGMRMLTPRELFRAQGFRVDYVIDVPVNGKPLSKAAQVRMCGNSVAPPAAAALIRANVLGLGVRSEAEQLDLFEAAS